MAHDPNFDKVRNELQKSTLLRELAHMKRAELRARTELLTLRAKRLATKLNSKSKANRRAS